MNKEVVIIVPGARSYKPETKIMKFLQMMILRMTGRSKPVRKDYSKDWAKKISNKNKKVVSFEWNRGITYFSLIFGGLKLRKFILENYRDARVKIVGISLGATLAEIASEKLNNLEKIIFVCPVHINKKRDFGKIKIVNIYSPKDKYLNFVNHLFFPFFGDVPLQNKKVKNIPVKGFTHDMFCLDYKVEEGKYKGKRITDILKKEI